MIASAEHRFTKRPESSYFDAVAQVLEEAAVLTGRGSEAPSRLSEWAVAHRELAPPAEWRSYSRLTADGAPVELVERLGPEPASLGFTLDPGPYRSTPAHRLQTALDLLAPQWPRAPRFAADLFPAGVPLGRFTLCLGWQSDTASVYGELGGPGAAGALERAERCLARWGLSPDAGARAVLKALLRHAYPKMLAVDLRWGRPVSAKLYLRLVEPIPAGPFQHYLQRMLGLRHTCSDPNAGVALAIGPGGVLSGQSFYHYVRPWFRDDEALRAAVLRLAEHEGWNGESYRALSRLVGGRTGSQLRGLIGYGLGADGVSQLKLYCRTGHLLEGAEQRRAA